MSERQARAIEHSIIALCLLALAFIFQPFAQALYTLGAGLIVLGGLAFNLIPHCVPGRPVSAVARIAAIVLVVLLIAVALAVGSAYLYVLYLGLR